VAKTTAEVEVLGVGDWSVRFRAWLIGDADPWVGHFAAYDHGHAELSVAHI
jgi:hypothetical protein